MNSDDAQMVAAALKDPDAFGVIVECFEVSLRRYVFRLGVSSQEDQDDILQGAFLKAWQNLQSYSPKFRLSTWLYRLVRNHTYSWLRSQKVQPTMVEFDPEWMGGVVEDWGEDENELKHEVLRKALQTLKPEYKEVLLLRYAEEVPYQEIADVLEVPTGTVSTRLKRAKESLLQAYSRLASLSFPA